MILDLKPFAEEVEKKLNDKTDQMFANSFISEYGDLGPSDSDNYILVENLERISLNKDTLSRMVTASIILKMAYAFERVSADEIADILTFMSIWQPYSMSSTRYKLQNMLHINRRTYLNAHKKSLVPSVD